MAESEATTVARPYARALFAHALESDAGLDHWSATLSLLAAVASNDVVAQVLDDPNITGRRRVEVLLELLGTDVSDQARNFIVILAERNRIELLPEISSLFELMKRNHEKRVEVSLVSAYEVDDGTREKIRAALAESLKREIAIETDVDPSLLGGAVVRTGDTVMDYSVRGKLNKLGRELNT